MPKAARPKPVIRGTKVLYREKAMLCRRPVELIVEQSQVSCPAPATAPAGLRIVGEFPLVSISGGSESGTNARPVVKGHTIAFAGTTVEFVRNCTAIAVNGKTYDIGKKGTGYCYELADGRPVGIHLDKAWA